ncbi:3-oxoacyl-[acyl-carrier protein] reductase [Catenulispora sp. MAP12-49]|uniref:SDR family oxidoreductase n=1 Tax=Catenulispora sp. MAP12-49 TaxID=3156302 RepID=UPI0035162E33
MTTDTAPDVTPDAAPDSTADSTRDSTRVAIVTGASRGIGHAVAQHLAADGYAVVLGYAGRADLAEKAVTEITSAGGRAIAVKADVADETAVKTMFDAAEQRFGGIDAVINAAGQMKLSTVADLNLDDLDAMHRTNIRGAFVVAQQAAKRLRTGGSLVLFSTSVMGTKFPTYAGYTASKGAVEAMTLILARELRGRDVTVNAIAPGPTATDMFLDGKDDELIAHLAAQNPLERLGQPEDIARVVAFLAGPEGHWVNGQIVRANGGMV